jgi:hypothetical protein
MEMIRAGKEIAVKKHIVNLSTEERERLEAMTCRARTRRSC